MLICSLQFFFYPFNHPDICWKPLYTIQLLFCQPFKSIGDRYYKSPFILPVPNRLLRQNDEGNSTARINQYQNGFIYDKLYKRRRSGIYLTVMKDHQEDTDYCFMEKLLPWSEHLPEICRSKTKTTNV